MIGFILFLLVLLIACFEMSHVRVYNANCTKEIIFLPVQMWHNCVNIFIYLIFTLLYLHGMYKLNLNYLLLTFYPANKINVHHLPLPLCDLSFDLYTPTFYRFGIVLKPVYLLPGWFMFQNSMFTLAQLIFSIKKKQYTPPNTGSNTGWETPPQNKKQSKKWPG